MHTALSESSTGIPLPQASWGEDASLARTLDSLVRFLDAADNMIEDRGIRVAGEDILLRFHSPAIADRMWPSFAARASESWRKPSLRVDVCAGETIGKLLADAGWNLSSGLDVLHVFRAEGMGASYQPAAGVLHYLDRVRGRGLFWLRDPKRVLTCPHESRQCLS